MLLWGWALTLAVLAPARLAGRIGPRLRPLQLGIALLAVLATLAALPIGTAAIGDGWPDAANPALLRSVIGGTAVGRAMGVQVAAAMLLALGAFVPLRWREPAVAAAAAFALLTLTGSGHAAAGVGWLGVGQRFIAFVHLLAGGAWLGALVPLVPILAALRDPAERRDSGVALRRFSLMGHGAVTLVILSGAANTILVLGRWPIDGRSPYQVLLLGKIAIVVAMVLLALVNRYRVVPRLAHRPERAMARLRAITFAELALGLVAIAVSAALGRLEPV